MFRRWEILTLKENDKTVKGITLGDIALIALTVIISAVMFIFSFSGDETLKAEIYLDGEMLYSISLAEVSEPYVLEVGGCEILVEGEGVSFLSSECPDKLCAGRGRLFLKGDAMACVPQRVVVALKGQGKVPDAITY